MTPPRRMLVVDDDPRVRLALRRLIDSTGGFRVTQAAGTAEQARDDRTAADVAVVDVRLPDRETGLRLIAALAARMPVVAVSVSSSVGPAALAAGAVAFCDKDGDADALLDALSPPRPDPSTEPP